MKYFDKMRPKSRIRLTRIVGDNALAGVGVMALAGWIGFIDFLS